MARENTCYSSNIKMPAAMWSIPPVVYLIYQWALTSYLLAVKVYSGVITHRGMKHLIYLTNWTYIVLTASFFIRATVSTVCHITHRKANPGEITRVDQSALPWYLSVVWVIYNIASTVSLMVTVMFWTAIYHGEGISFNNFNAHAVNSMIVLLDLGVTAIPFRLFHFYLPMIYAALFGLFAIIYWATGGTDPFGHPYIYPVLDYGNRTKLAILLSIGIAFVAIPLCHVVIFGLHKLRVCIHDRLHPPDLECGDNDIKIEISVSESKDLETELTESKGREYA